MMKRLLLLVLAGVLSYASCNNANKKSSHDQSKQTSEQNLKSENNIRGVFSGTLPCASCPGIETTLKFNSSNKVEKTTLYLDSNDTEKTVSGTYKINKNENVIVVSLPDGEKEFYRKKSDSSIAMLKSDKKEVTGPLADNYILTKKNM